MKLRVLFPVFSSYIVFNIVGRPFAREFIITEKLSEENAYSTVDGEGSELPEVKQLTGLKLRYLPPGATMPTKTVKAVKSEKKEKKEKAEKTPKKSKKEKTPKKKSK